MTVSKIVDLHCDRCAWWDERLTAEDVTPSEIRRRGKRLGWIHNDGNDICPYCVDPTLTRPEPLP